MKRYGLILFLVIGVVFLFLYKNEKDDYYDVINRNELSKEHLSDDTLSWSRFSDAQDKAFDKSNQIIMDIVSDNKYNLDDKIVRNMKVLYDNALDLDERNRIGLGPLKLYIDKIMECNDINDFISEGINVENDLGVNIFSNLVIDADYLDNKKGLVYFYPITLAFGSNTDIFVSRDYIAYKAYIKRGINRLFKLYGYDKKNASLITNQLISFYEEIGKESYDSKYLEDMGNYYNVLMLDKLDSLYSNINVRYYLNLRGIYRDRYSVIDEGQIRFLNNNLTNDRLMIWKYYAVIQILSNYASYLGSDYEGVVIDLNKAISSGNSSDSNERGLEIVHNVFSSSIDKVFSDSILMESDKKYLEDLFIDIKDVYRNLLEDNDWLSKDTKEFAIKKLDKMKMIISSNDNFDDGVYDFNDDGLIYNVIEYYKISYKRELERLDNFYFSKVLSDTVVNAFYRPLNNTIVIPSAFFYLMNDKDEFARLGSVGMILSHEVTHGFDGNGSLFDDSGNYVNWWNDKDRKKFLKLQRKVSDYYSNFEVLGGRYIDGDKTVNENIADLGALNVISGIALKRGASKVEFKKMYSSFASLWASEEDKHYMKLLLLVDTHSPNKYRVNAVLSSTDKFYDIYDIHFWDDMYISSKDRVRVW